LKYNKKELNSGGGKHENKSG